MGISHICHRSSICVRKWAIIGAGPVGLTLALTLAESMQSRGLDPEVATVEIYLSWIEQDNSKWQRDLEDFSSRILFGWNFEIWMLAVWL
jgi:malate/lactate dehydrogenase